MTIVEWILLIEVVIFAVLGIMLVLMLFNRNRTGRIRQSRGSALSGTNCPAQNSCDLYRMSYPRIDNHPTVYNAARYAQDPQYFENQWNYYGSAAAGPGSYQEARLGRSRDRFYIEKDCRRRIFLPWREGHSGI